MFCGRTTVSMTHIRQESSVENIGYLKVIDIYGTVFDEKLLENTTYLAVLIAENWSRINDANVIYPNLVHLSLMNCEIDESSNILKNSYKMLRNMTLKRNPIRSTSFLSICRCFELEYMDISLTNIKVLLISHWDSLRKLRVLKILKNKIRFISEVFFKNLNRLESVYLRFDGSLKSSKLMWMSHLSPPLTFYSNDKRLYCLIHLISEQSVKCSRLLNENCSSLLSSPVLVFVFWLFGLIGVLGNLTSIILVLTTKTFSKTFKLTLSLCDFFSSIYILIIACLEVYYGKDYLKYDEEWRSNALCKILGVCLSFFMILSPFSLLLIAFERFLSVYSPFKKKKILNYPGLLVLAGIFVSVGSSVGVFLEMVSDEVRCKIIIVYLYNKGNKDWFLFEYIRFEQIE